MHDIDTILARVRSAPLPTALTAIDGAVIDSLGAQPGATIIRPIGLAAMAALAFGILGGIPGGKGEAVAAVAPLGTPSPLAPSSLLVGAR